MGKGTKDGSTGRWLNHLQFEFEGLSERWIISGGNIYI